MATRTLTVKLVGDTKRLDKAFSSVGSKMAGLGRTAGKLGLGIAGALGASVVALTPLIGKASDLNEELSKSEAVFGKASAAVQAFGRDAATNIGLSETAALEAVNKFGQFGKAAGLTGRELSTFGTDLATLSADLASFNNLEVGEAAEKLAAGLSGESEPLKQLGIFINAAAVDAKGLELGLGDVNGKLSDQEKIIARQALIFEQTADAQGDFAKTSDGLANKTRILGAQFENLQTRLGQKFLPIALQVGDALLRFVDFIGPKIEPVFQAIATAVLSLSAAFKIGGLKGVGKLLVSQASDIWDKLRDWIGETTPKVVAKVKEWAPPFWEWLKGAAVTLVEKAGELLGKLTDWIKGDGLTQISDKLIEWADAFIRWVAPLIPPLLKELGKLALAILDWVVFDLAPKLLSTMWDLGKDAAVSLWQGMENKLKSFGNFVVPFAAPFDTSDGGGSIDFGFDGVPRSRSMPRGDGPSGDRSILGGVGASAGPRMLGGTSGGAAREVVIHNHVHVEPRKIARATRDGSHELGGIDIKVRNPR